MLWEEGDINAYEYKPEMDFASASMKGDSSYKGKSVGECGEKCKDSAYRKYIMEMGYDIVCVMEDNVKRGIG